MAFGNAFAPFILNQLPHQITVFIDRNRDVRFLICVSWHGLYRHFLALTLEEMKCQSRVSSSVCTLGPMWDDKPLRKERLNTFIEVVCTTSNKQNILSIRSNNVTL